MNSVVEAVENANSSLN
jgi:hypothetical protein